MYDIVIRNGKVADFEKGVLKTADVGIKDGKILDVGNCPEQGKRTIDGENMVVSPGFIDIHMHEEVIGNTVDGDDYDIANKMLRMGVTTAVGGNCGNNRQKTDVFMDFVEKNGAPINYLSYIGHNFLRKELGIDEYRSATKSEVRKMQEMAKVYIEEHGAIGVSFGIEYSPSISFEELIAMGNSVDYNDIMLAAHYRADADKSVASIIEMIDISKETGKPMQISHIGSCSAFGHMTESLKLIQKAIDEGYSIEADCYPYDAFSTRIGSAVFDEGCFEAWNKSYDSILLTEDPYKGKYCDEALFYRARKDYPSMLAVAFVMNEEEVIEALNAPFMSVASDALLNRSAGHPRAAGTFPRVLGKYARDEKAIPFMDALRKMTQVPARRMGLDAKGEIKPGFDADITIFNPDTIIDKATFMDPVAPPVGISHVIVAGKVALEGHDITQGRLGKTIRRNQLSWGK